MLLLMEQDLQNLSKGMLVRWIVGIRVRYMQRWLRDDDSDVDMYIRTSAFWDQSKRG